MLKPLKFQARFHGLRFRSGSRGRRGELAQGEREVMDGSRLACQRSLTPGDGLFVPNAENLLVSGSIEQSRTVYRFIRSMLGEANYRYLDSATRLGITHTPSLTRLRVLSSDSKAGVGYRRRAPCHS